MLTASADLDFVRAQGAQMGADMRYEEMRIEGRNAVIEAIRSGRPIDRLYVLERCQDGPLLTIKSLAAKKNVPVQYVSGQRLRQMSNKFLPSLYNAK